MVRRILPLFMLLALASAPAPAHEPGRSVTVEGTGSATAMPDTAEVRLAIQSRHASLDTARDTVLRVAGDFLTLARRLQIPEEHVQSTGLTVHPEYRWNDSEQRQELTGYLVQRNFDVTLEDLGKLPELLEGAVDAGVNQVSPPVLGSSRERDLHRTALAAAARDAQANARALADSLGATLGEVLRITTVSTPPPQPLYRERMMAAAEMASAGETYTAGRIRIESRVTATFALAGN